MNFWPRIPLKGSGRVGVMAADSNETSWVNEGLHAETLCIGNVPPLPPLGEGEGALQAIHAKSSKSHISGT